MEDLHHWLTPFTPLLADAQICVMEDPDYWLTPPPHWLTPFTPLQADAPHWLTPTTTTTPLPGMIT